MAKITWLSLAFCGWTVVASAQNMTDLAVMNDKSADRQVLNIGTNPPVADTVFLLPDRRKGRFHFQRFFPLFPGAPSAVGRSLPKTEGCGFQLCGDLRPLELARAEYAPFRPGRFANRLGGFGGVLADGRGFRALCDSASRTLYLCGMERRRFPPVVDAQETGRDGL